MEVVPAQSDSSPFQRRDVAEWSHMDRLTGMMETARVETDRWAASTPTSAHAYGKVVDSRNRSLPDGSAQQRQRQQLEVFQTKGPGGSLQVIRTQTVTSTNSSWRGTTSFAGSRAPLPAVTQDFGNLQLTLNPLDLSSVKNKGSVGRSGSIGGRRPPSRPRSLILAPRLAIEEDSRSSTASLVTSQSQSQQQLSQVRRLCQQAHDDAKKTMLNGGDRPAVSSLSLRELSSSTSSKTSSIISNGHSSISRQKSSSIEDLHNGSAEGCDEEEHGIKRSSKIRRSLQFPLKKVEAHGGVGKILKDLEENKRNDVRIARRSFEALENVLKRGNNIIDTLNKSEDSDSLHTGSETSGEFYSKHTVNNINLESLSRRLHSANRFSVENRYSLTDASDSKDEQESSNDEGKVSKSPAAKRHSFVSVESLKEVRGRLKKLNSPLDGLDVESGLEEIEDNDDVIETENKTKSDNAVGEVTPSRVRSYVYGMEAISRSNRQPVIGTGSLESRTSNKNSNNNRSDEWYNRRKSYGFEKVTSDQTNDSSSTLSSNGERSKLESTDSGICRSSETFTVPSWNRTSSSNAWNKSGETDVLSVFHALQINKSKDDQHVRDDEKENLQKKGTTVVKFGSKNEQSNDNSSNNTATDIFRRKEGTGNLISALLVNGVRGDNSIDKGRNQQVIVSIPVVQDDSSPTVESRRLFYQQLAQGTTVSVERSSKKQVNSSNEDQTPLFAVAKVGGDDWWMKSNVNSADNFQDSKLGDEDWRVPSKLLSSAMKRHSFAGEHAWKNVNGNDNKVEFSEEGSRSEGSGWKQMLKPTDTETKRHSIAVDELKYVKENSPVSAFNVSFSQQTREDLDTFASKKHKKVEFCKTEVHFAAEPGRFNIVETDEKPPSTNMFRRRRRPPSDPPVESAKTSNLPEVRFGDSIYEKHLLGRKENDIGPATTTLATRPTSLRLELEDEALPDKDDHVYAESTAVMRTSDLTIDKAEQHIDFESSLECKPRSILKNYSKTQLHLFGESDDSSPSADGDQEDKWGVRLRPVSLDRSPVWKPTVTLSSRDAVMPVEYSGQSELQKLLRSLRPANQRKHELMLANRLSGFTKTPEMVSDWSVAERIRHVEQVASESKGFSTRVNFGAGEATVVDENVRSNVDANNRLYALTDHPKTVWQRREEALTARDENKYDPHQRKGLVVHIGKNSFETKRNSSYTSSLDAGDSPRNSTTTKITIGLSDETMSKDVSKGDLIRHYNNTPENNLSQQETLSSPSLIMKSVTTPVENNIISSRLFRKSCLSNFQGNKRPSVEMHSNSFLNGGIRSYPNDSKSWISEYNLKRKTNARRHAMVIGTRGIADGEVQPSIKEELFRDDRVNHAKHWRDTEERDCDDVMVESSRWKPHKKIPNNTEHAHVVDRCWSEADVGEKGSAEEVVVAGQLGAWRALYCDIDSELSDDSEKADEEVRSFMSTEGEGGSEVSGSWSRVTALRHFQKHAKQERVKDYAVSESRTDTVESQQVHSSVTTAVLPSYGDAGKLRAVETLVNTRSGHPKITSISLRYEGDQNNSAIKPPTPEVSGSYKFTSTTSISPERRHSSYIETERKPMPKEKRSSTFLEPSNQVESQLITLNDKNRLEGNNTSALNKMSSYSVKTQLDNSLQRSSYSDRLSTDSGCDYHCKKPSSQQTVFSTEKPVQTLSHLSAFDKRNYTSKITPSPSQTSTSYSSASNNTHKINDAAHLSSSRVVSCFDKKDSISSSNQRSSLFEEPSKSIQSNRSTTSIINPRPQRYELSKSEMSSILDFNKTSPLRREMQTKKLSLFDSPSITSESLHTTSSQSKHRHRESPLGFQETTEPRLKSTKVECETGTVTKTMSVSPSPTKKVTSPSKNSINKDFIGRVRSESPIDKEPLVSPRKILSPSEKHTNLQEMIEKSTRKSRSQSPIYQNQEVFTVELHGSKRSSKTSGHSEIKLTECGLEAIETDSVILEELTRAAEQILQAVHGYTDDDSRRASSDDDSQRNKLKEKRTLGTISEAPPLRKKSTVKKEASPVNGTTKRTQSSGSKTKLGPTSSTSSIESVTRDTRRNGTKTERAASTSSRSATSTRTARMVQRANSRELLLQSHASSSEDVASGTDTKKPRVPPPRRSRTSTSTSKVSATAATKPSEKQKESTTEISRTSRERISSSKVKSRDATSGSYESKRKTPETKQYPVKEKTIPGIVSSSSRDRSSSSRTTASGTRTKKSSASRYEGSAIKK